MDELFEAIAEIFVKLLQPGCLIWFLALLVVVLIVAGLL